MPPHAAADAQMVSRWRAVRAAVRAAECEAGRDPGCVSLVAVSKGVAARRVEALLAAGQRIFAENRVREMLDKWPPLLQRYPTTELRFVGRLQTNKVREAVGIADAIESVDRESLARALAASGRVGGRARRLLVQVNVGEEPQKGGCRPAEADSFIAWCRSELGLEIAGVMGIPPAHADPAPYFGLLRSLRDRLGLQQLSMGMSADFESAVRLGATHVRVGTAVFGPRPQVREEE